MSIADHAVFHSVARQFVVFADGAVHADRFMEWINRREQHELHHSFMAALAAVAPDVEDPMREYCEVLAIEFKRWCEEQGRPLPWKRGGQD